MLTFWEKKHLTFVNCFKDKPAHPDADFGDSDVEDAPDAYLARVKAEGEERVTGKDDFSRISGGLPVFPTNLSGEDSGSDSDETDEDFKPGEESDVAEEYDSNVATTDSDDSGASGGGKGSGGGKVSGKGKGSGSDSDAKPSEKKKKKPEKKESKEAKTEKKKPAVGFFYFFFCYFVF